MIIYEIEKTFGLEDQLSVASTVIDIPVISQENYEPEHSLIDFAKAGIKLVNDPDINQNFSILVTTVWNANDDVFDKKEVWEAKETPKNKLVNLDHDHTQIIGSISDVWPVDLDFHLISLDTLPDDLPDEYHLLVSSLICTKLQDPVLKAKVDNLVEEINSGSKFVSMECIFRNFDYAIITPEGEQKILARNEQTAFLTRYLRAYGGPGEYQGYKIGRLLRDITFSGKGYVDRPANKDSIIFDKDHIFSFAKATEVKNIDFKNNGVNSDEEEVDFSQSEKLMDNEILNEQIADLKKSLATLQEENKKLNEQLSEANVTNWQEKVQAKESEVETLEAKVAELETANKELSSQSKDLTEKLDEQVKAGEKMKVDMKKMEDEKKEKERKAKMVKAGLSEEDVNVKYPAFAGMTDDQFDAVVDTFAKMSVATEDSVEEVEDDSTEASEVVDEDSTDDTNHSVANDDSSDDDISTAVASIQEWVENCILDK